MSFLHLLSSSQQSDTELKAGDNKSQRAAHLQLHICGVSWAGHCSPDAGTYQIFFLWSFTSVILIVTHTWFCSWHCILVEFVPWVCFPLRRCYGYKCTLAKQIFETYTLREFQGSEQQNAPIIFIIQSHQALCRLAKCLCYNLLQAQLRSLIPSWIFHQARHRGNEWASFPDNIIHLFQRINFISVAPQFSCLKAILISCTLNPGH